MNHPVPPFDQSNEYHIVISSDWRPGESPTNRHSGQIHFREKVRHRDRKVPLDVAAQGIVDALTTDRPPYHLFTPDRGRNEYRKADVRDVEIYLEGLILYNKDINAALGHPRFYSCAGSVFLGRQKSMIRTKSKEHSFLRTQAQRLVALQEQRKDKKTPSFRILNWHMRMEIPSPKEEGIEPKYEMPPATEDMIYEYLVRDVEIFFLMTSVKDDDFDFSPALQKANAVLQREILDIRFVRGEGCPAFDVTSVTKQLLKFINKDFHQGISYTDGTYNDSEEAELCVLYKMREPQQMNLVTRWAQADKERLDIGECIIISDISRVRVLNLGCAEVWWDEVEDDFFFHVFRSVYQGITSGNPKYFSNGMDGSRSDFSFYKESEEHFMRFLIPSEDNEIARLLAGSYKYWVRQDPGGNKRQLEAATTSKDTSMGSSDEPKLKSAKAGGEVHEMDAQYHEDDDSDESDEEKESKDDNVDGTVVFVSGDKCRRSLRPGQDYFRAQVEKRPRDASVKDAAQHVFDHFEAHPQYKLWVPDDSVEGLRRRPATVDDVKSYIEELVVFDPKMHAAIGHERPAAAGPATLHLESLRRDIRASKKNKGDNFLRKQAKQLILLQAPALTIQNLKVFRILNWKMKMQVPGTNPPVYEVPPATEEMILRFLQKNR